MIISWQRFKRVYQVISAGFGRARNVEHILKVGIIRFQSKINRTIILNSAITDGIRFQSGVTKIITLQTKLQTEVTGG